MNIATRNKFSFVLLGMFFSACAFSAAAVAGHGPKWDRPGFMGGFDDVSPLEHMAAELDLTADQQEAIKAIAERTRSGAEMYRGQQGEYHRDMQSLLDADSFDEKQVREMIAQKQQAMTELMVLHMRQRFDINAVLTPEQRIKFNDMAGPHRRQCRHAMP